MLTGARPIEAMKASWEEFDAEPGYWCKPSAHTKQRKVHRLPLSPPAVQLIERLRKKRKGRWVFAGDVPGKHLTVLSRVWKFVRKETGIGNARLYDLRHSFASVGAGGGLSLAIIGKLLGHSQARTTECYVHLLDDALKEAAHKVGNAIAGNGTAEIVPLSGKAR
jgi:integrase